MELTFTKMHGIGNDFIVIDARDIDLAGRFDRGALARTLCSRRFGVGADQVLLLLDSGVADFTMKIYNADGSEVEMCGNGIRCLAKYVWDRGLSTKDTLEIDTLAGVIRPERAGNLVRVDMGEPVFDAERIPVNLESASPIVDYPLRINDREFKVTCVSMGNPHAVVFMEEDIADFPVALYGPIIETHTLFPNKTNVEFVTVGSRKDLTMRVWERGSGETMACGTGASAVGVAAMLKGLTERTVTVHLLGGDLVIEWPQNGHVYMTGPAEEVFEGRIASIAGRGQNSRDLRARHAAPNRDSVTRANPEAPQSAGAPGLRAGAGQD